MNVFFVSNEQRVGQMRCTYRLTFTYTCFQVHPSVRRYIRKFTFNVRMLGQVYIYMVHIQDSMSVCSILTPLPFEPYTFC